MGDIQLLSQLSTSEGLVEIIVEFWVDGINLGDRELFTSEYNHTVNVVKAIIVFLCLIREPTIIKEDLLKPLVRCWLWGHPDGDSI